MEIPFCSPLNYIIMPFGLYFLLNHPTAPACIVPPVLYRDLSKRSEQLTFVYIHYKGYKMKNRDFNIILDDV